MGVNQSTVSRRLSMLEKQLGARLFERSTSQGWVLTAAGERIVAAAEDMEQHAGNIQRQVLINNTEIAGNVRLTIGDCSLLDTIMPTIDEFCQAHPGVQLQIISSNEQLDLAAREADIAIRVTADPPQNLVGKRIADIKYAVYGTRELLDAYLDGARDIPCITWLDEIRGKPPWIGQNFPAARIYRINSPSVAKSMVNRGMGIILAPCAMGDPSPDIRRLPIDFPDLGMSMWVLSHIDLRTTARVRMLRNVLVGALEKQVDLLEGRCEFHCDKAVAVA